MKEQLKFCSKEELIHWHTHGNIIKNWVHSKNLARELEKVNVRLLRVQ